MAQICVNGVRECEGCTVCKEGPQIVHTCVNCDDDIYEGDTVCYVVGDTYCGECASFGTA